MSVVDICNSITTTDILSLNSLTPLKLGMGTKNQFLGFLIDPTYWFLWNQLISVCVSEEENSSAVYIVHMHITFKGWGAMVKWRLHPRTAGLYSTDNMGTLGTPRAQSDKAECFVDFGPAELELQQGFVCGVWTGVYRFICFSVPNYNCCKFSFNN